MADHSTLTSTRLEIVGAKPTTEPVTGESQIRLQLKDGGLLVWVWNATGTVWEGGQLRPLQTSGNPTGTQTPDFVGQMYWDTGANKMYYAEGATSSDWIEMSGTGGGGGGS